MYRLCSLHWNVLSRVFAIASQDMDVKLWSMMWWRSPMSRPAQVSWPWAIRICDRYCQLPSASDTAMLCPTQVRKLVKPLIANLTSNQSNPSFVLFRSNRRNGTWTVLGAFSLHSPRIHHQTVWDCPMCHLDPFGTSLCHHTELERWWW